MMDAATAARAIDGALRGPNAWFSGVSTDSRSLAPGDLFVAIKGDKFDGHDFVSQAFGRGAAAAIVAADRAAELGAAMRNAAAETMLCVADPIKALGALAKFWRRRFSLPVPACLLNPSARHALFRASADRFHTRCRESARTAHCRNIQALTRCVSPRNDKMR